jgi:two-component system OmpR family sensor kinase
MHELKTPIGKGRILNAFLETKELKEGYDEVFERLELLLHEFSKIEQMLSSNYVVQLQNYQAKDLIEQALEILILDEKTLEKQVAILNTSDLMVHTDFTLFSLALKNLIDNGLKYASDHAVEIQITQTAITVASKGEQFTDTIEEYYKPFHGKGKGLGLGLYIVYNITQMLKLGFVYRYAEGKNIFTILINE